MDKIKTIGFDAKRIVSNATGLGSYGRTLVNSLSTLPDPPALRLYAPDSGRADLRQQVNRNEFVEFVYSDKIFGLTKALWRSHGIVDDLVRDRIDLFHGLSGELPVGIRRKGIPTLVTIHDLIFLRHPEYYHWVDVQLYKRKFYATLREADRIVAISERTKQDILHFSDFPEDRIDVIYQSCSRSFNNQIDPEIMRSVRLKYGLPDQYMLSVGSIEERKNLLLAVKALELLPDEVHLVAVGRKTKYTDSIIEYAAQHRLSSRLHLLHGIPNDDLPYVYHGTKVFVYPSRYEGFGIPVIEAIQCGLPVVAATGSCLEEAGGPHCLYVQPDDVEAMADAIIQYWSDEMLRQQSVAQSRNYIRRFENANIAQKMMAEYAKLGI